MGKGNVGLSIRRWGQRHQIEIKPERVVDTTPGGENVEYQGESVKMEPKRTFVLRRLEESKEVAKDSSSQGKRGQGRRSMETLVGRQFSGRGNPNSVLNK